MGLAEIKTIINSEIDDLPDIDCHNIKKVASVLRALNHRLRQEIIKLIYENKRLNVTQVCVKLFLDQSVTSQHLAILLKAVIVIAEREGKFILYSIHKKRILAINQLSKDLLNY